MDTNRRGQRFNNIQSSLIEAKFKFGNMDSSHQNNNYTLRHCLRIWTNYSL